MTSNRPKWEFEIEEEKARWLLKGVHCIEHRSEMTGVDTDRQWLVLIRRARTGPDPCPEQSLEVTTTFLNSSYGEAKYFYYAPSYRSLVEPTRAYGQDLEKRVREIDDWEAQNVLDRAEFERLKAKFA